MRLASAQWRETPSLVVRVIHHVQWARSLMNSPDACRARSSMVRGGTVQTELRECGSYGPSSSPRAALAKVNRARRIAGASCLCLLMRPLIRARHVRGGRSLAFVNAEVASVPTASRLHGTSQERGSP